MKNNFSYRKKQKTWQLCLNEFDVIISMYIKYTERFSTSIIPDQFLNQLQVTISTDK